MSESSTAKSRNHLLADQALCTIKKHITEPKKLAEFAANFQYGMVSHEICNGDNAKSAWQNITSLGVENEVLSAVTEWRIKFVDNGTQWADITSDVSHVLGMVALNNESLIPESTTKGFASVEEIQRLLDANPWLTFLYFVAIADWIPEVRG